MTETNYIEQSVIPALRNLEEEAADGSHLLTIVIDTEQGTSSILLNKALEAHLNFEEMMYEVSAHIANTVKHIVDHKARLHRLDS